ncbi:MAG: Glycine-rich RNA-binding protein [uncultured bacterium]|uniref:RRM domain RNA-binding protein n=2 Tax=Candidatus Daviesiibacteriota TaxID=1752718 RepID=A0A0G0EUF1_9BACT|nr:MAG: Glycine-rich RNA-binding protein [uncultured bacterium]KKQ09202.1 MAG: RRM domain RNA-binding protein [Candidatus Daviesbacteria bacterium GW2011_GWB1_36_5]KKQ14800.1 MAG: RRM domain RNA-binding protein [Candidatus Daviesbacteria bacterium GW2011_GWA1_36_8]
MITISKKLFVGSLPWGVDDSGLREAFSKYGEIIQATVLKDRQTGRSRGFGFVEFANDADGDKAIQEMNGADMDGRNIVVNEARPREN